MALMQLRFARQVVPLSDWPTLLKVESINVPLGLLISHWAMRQALTLNYSDFHVRWIEAAPMPKEIADSPIKDEGRDADGPNG
jgi:hypothetical protein